MEQRTFLEQQFYDKAKDTEYQILADQWGFDKKLVNDALKNVGNIFPHYSLHDESHSNTILNNITNTLGEDAIKELSVTDLWLILESAYCHDLGMVVTADMIDKALKDENFSLLDFHSTILADVSNPLHEYAECFEQKDGHLLYKDPKFSVDSYNAVKYLLSGYFRKFHASNAKKAVTDPVKNLSMHSPRIIIPRRLFTVLGEICAAHGEDFDFVMKLNRVENGLGSDMAHPRFVACMLRIGDLLDIDDNRFSEMALRTMHKTRMPKDSLNHYDKHHSIRHLRIDNRHIEASATCPNPQVAKVTKEWFDWIADEFNQQTSHWNDIKPHKQDCYLPTIGDLSVDIEGYYNFDSKQMPQFTINTGKALELLQGNNLYDNIWDSIREVLQNAVDSTLIRYYKGKKDEKGELPSDELKQEYLDELESFPIEVNLEKGGDGIYTLTIKDKGMGLKRDHLKFLSNTGNSSNNLEKKKIVEEMPEWLKPSGTFGIGFQSVYLLTDKVDILTKDYLTDECYALEMHKPSSGMRGDIYVKKVKAEERLHHSGLELKIKLNSDKVIEIDKEKVDVFNAVESASRIENSISREVEKYGEISLVPIKYNGKEIERRETLYYDKENGIELLEVSAGWGGNNLYYRNAKIDYNASICSLDVSANILKGKASDMLGISRDKLKDEYEEEIEKCIVQSIKNWILSDSFDINRIKGGDKVDDLKIFAMYYNYCKELDGRLRDCYDVDIRKLDSDFLIKDDERITVNNLKEAERVENYHIEDDDELVNCYEDKNCYFLYSRYYLDNEIRVILNNLFENYYYIGDGNLIFSHKDIVSEIEEVKFYSYGVDNSRIYHPYTPGFEDIYIPSGKGVDEEGIGLDGYLDSQKSAKILSPFLLINGEIVDARNDAFYEFVRKCNGKPIEVIKDCYDRYVEHVINVNKEVDFYDEDIQKLWSNVRTITSK